MNALGDMKDGVMGLTSQVMLLSNGFDVLGSKGVPSMDRFFTGLTHGYDRAKAGVGSVKSQLDELGTNINAMPLPQVQAMLGTLMTLPGMSGAAGQALSSAFSQDQNIGKLVAGLKNIVGGNIAALEANNQMANAMLANAAKIGNITFKPGENIGDAYLEFNKSIAQTEKLLLGLHDSTGVQTEQLSELYTQMSRMPNIFEKTGEATTALGKNINVSGQDMNALEAITKVAAGTFQELGVVTDKVRDMRGKYNMSTESSLQLISMESVSSQKLGIDLETTASVMEGMIEKVGMLSNNVEASDRVFENMASRLNQVGISGKQAGSIIKTFTDQVGGLEIAQRAFLSQQSGGPGGLMGAFQITKMISEGKLDEVAKMAEASLKKQMGGRIVSMEEASRSEQAATQYTKQLKLLQGGAFGSLAHDENSAIKLLESFGKSNQTNTKVFDDVKTGTDALNDTIQRGHGLQQVTNTNLSHLNTTMEMFLLGSRHIQSNVGRDLTTRNKDRGQETTIRMPDDFTNGQHLMASGLANMVDIANDIRTQAPANLSQAAEHIFGNTAAILTQQNEITRKRLDLEAEQKKAGNNKTAEQIAADGDKTAPGSRTQAQKDAMALRAQQEMVNQAAGVGTAKDKKTEQAGSTFVRAAQAAPNVAVTVMMECPDCHAKKHMPSSHTDGRVPTPGT